ncbi:MAG: hypothetical protein H6605_04920 [Flavobacteriales bacterium]|nr:hypothetical protein [Flavobacteriales bacterium]
MKKFILFIGLLLSVHFSFSQNYGNEWIQFNQDYFKIKIGKEGLYKIPYSTLKGSGFPVGIPNADHIRMWINGKELPILVKDGSNNQLDSGDYILFYGTYNNGELDNELYLSPGEQPHQKMSLFTDTSVYFLTISSDPGLRVDEYNDLNYSGKTPEPYFLNEEFIYFTPANKGQSYDGFGFAKEGFYSEFTEGEGWAMQFSGSPVSVRFLTPKLSLTGPKPFLESLIHSRANNTGGYDVDGFNNGVKVSYSNGTVINTQRVNGYGRYLFQDSLDSKLIGSTSTDFKFESYLLSKSIHSISYTKLIYPRQFHLNDSSYFKFNYNSVNNFIRFTGYPLSLNKPMVYDILNNTYATATVSAGTLSCNLSMASSNRQILIVDESRINVLGSTGLIKYRFNEIIPLSGQDYLMISHPSLDSGARAYKNYLSTTTGGQHNVLLAYTSDIYDQFYYGIKHPMAIKNLCRFAKTNVSGFKYLLLLGKGQKYINTRFNPAVNYKFDLVPTYGLPPSDMFFVTGYLGSTLNPVMATGRLPATSNIQIANYIDKLSDHVLNGTKSWNKNVLQLAGGYNKSEVDQFVGYQNNFFNIMKLPKWAVNRKLITKQDPSPIDSSLKQKIQQEINKGYAMIDYFGHGSTQASDIDIGDAYQLNNFGKYPFYYFNGCGLGNTFDGGSLAEDYLFTKNKGALGWLAGTTFGYVGELYYYAIVLHQKLTQNTDLSFAENVSLTIENYQLPTNFYNRAQCRQMLFMGDPSVRLFNATLPDYTVDAARLKIYPSKVTAEADSFAIKIYPLNLAAATEDSFTLRVVQTLPNGTRINHKGILNRPVYNNDSLIYWMKRPSGVNMKGLNSFSIEIDTANSVAEQAPLGETNNSISYQYSFTSTNAQILFPLKDNIVPAALVELTAQSLVFNKAEYDFYFEMDTVPTFNSPFKLNSGPVKSSYIATHKFNLLPTDSTDYYWRVRIDDGSGTGIWDESTFAGILGSPKGWSQGYFQKFLDAPKNQMVYDTVRHLQFTTTQSLPYVIETSGKNSSATWRTIWHEGYPLYFGYLTKGGILVVAISQKDESRFCLPSKHNVISEKSPWWQAPTNYLRPYFEKPGVSPSCSYYYNMFNKADRDSFIYFLDQIPKDYTLMLMTGPNHNIPNWEDTIFRTLEKFGAVQTRTVLEQEPYILVGKKGDLPGSAIEKLSDPNNPLPGKDQYIFVNTTINVLADSGSMSSTRIGPSTSWKYFYRTLEPIDTLFDLVKFDIYGIRQNGTSSKLYAGIKDRELSLSSVDPVEFPYLRLEADIEDSVNKTPNGIARWTVLFEGLPEGAMNPLVSLVQNKDTLDEGDTLNLKVAYTNIYDLDLDSMLVLITSVDENNTIDTLDFRKFKDLKPDDDLILEKSILTEGQFGNYLINISVNPNMAQPEQYLFNNNWQFAYHVMKDEEKPYLDVVFDGRHIINNEIITPSPEITISAGDNNKYLLMDDPNYFKVKIKYPGELNFTSLNVNSDTFEFIPSTGPDVECKLIYRPKYLVDGVYEMAVSVVDAKGNLASVEDYTITFRIITKATITNVYPYPNPFTTKTRFVFTLTGEQVPDVFKISIMTISGRLIKEIDQTEIGPLRIGNNISEYEWDGTDEYGDRLANGVYLYKITTRLNGKEIEMSETGADHLFKKGIGKLYIMR